MNYNKREIKPLTNEKGKTLVKVGNQRSVDNRIVFSFSFFNGQSICISDFNNFYATRSDSMKSVSDFFQTLKDISNFEIKQFFSPAVKTQFHYNEFDDNKVIDRIENILIDGYGIPKQKVDEFERLYFEFSFSNGKRAIGTRIYDNIFEILFIDCNHMVCLESCRTLKIKMKYNFPSLFGRFDKEVEFSDFNREKLLEMLIDGARKGDYTSVGDFVKDYDDLFTCL